MKGDQIFIESFLLKDLTPFYLFENGF